jgi:hypothetical protein
MYSEIKPNLSSANRAIRSVADCLITDNPTESDLEARSLEAEEISDFFTHNKMTKKEETNCLVAALGYLSFDERDRLMVGINRVLGLSCSLKNEMGQDKKFLFKFRGSSMRLSDAIIKMRQTHLEDIAIKPLQQLATEHPDAQPAIENLLNKIERAKKELVEADQFPWTAIEHFSNDINELGKAAKQQGSSTHNLVTTIKNMKKKWGLKRQENTFVKEVVQFFRDLFHIANAKSQKTTVPFCRFSTDESVSPIPSSGICAAC